MNYKAMVELAKRTSIKLTPSEELALKSKDAVRINDGVMRWFEEGQEILFDEPHYYGFNAEFCIKDKPYQKIWFSQLTAKGMDVKLETPLLDEILFKGESASIIAKRFTTPRSFWNAVKEKKFRVEIIGNGVTLNNKNCPLVESLRRSYSAELYSEDVDTRIFDYIRHHIEEVEQYSSSKPLKPKKAYRLIEV